MQKMTLARWMVSVLFSGGLLAACAPMFAPEGTMEAAIAAESPVGSVLASPTGLSGDELESAALPETGAPVEGESAPVSGAAQVPLADGLRAEEAAGLAYMIEEEKLAHDVYVALFEKWGAAVFQNIAGSETAHVEAVRSLLERYGLQDPTAGSEPGVFSDPALQALYTQLIDLGGRSLADALKVGAAVEEIDILDLEERMLQTDQPDILQVYQNLTAGSENHLRAFVSVLERQTGEMYSPQYLTQERFDAILGSQTGRGRQNGRASGPQVE